MNAPSFPDIELNHSAYERSLVPGLPLSRLEPANPLRRMEQLRGLASKRYPEGVSSTALAELRREDLRDYRSILAEVRGYVHLQMKLHRDRMAAGKSWDMDELVRLQWQIQKAFLKLRLAPHVPQWWRARLVSSARADFAAFAPLAPRA